MTEQEADRTIFERRDPLIGHAFDGRYRIDARLAAGGFGAIYRATELRSGREIALKVLHANLTTDPLIAARFRREGETLASLRDPHTVTAYELGETADGTLYIAMELLRGETLYEAYHKNGGPLPWRRVTAIARAVCSSLAEAHERGIVHRDLKPANIHLQERDGKRDFVKVLDFGIAKIQRGSDLDPAELTIAGQMIGTFDYMAPEQMLGGAVGPRCDIYTLGVVMYEMITGRLPFAAATSPTHLLAMLLTTSPPSLSDGASVPAELERVVMRCLEREQQERYQDVRELAAALDRVLAIRPDDEAPRTELSAAVEHEDATWIAQRPTPAPAPRGAPTPAPRGAPTHLTPVPRGVPTHLTPSHGARLRDAISPAHPIAPAGDVRAEGSQPVIMPHAAAGRGSQPHVDPRGSQPYADPRGSQPYVDSRGSQPYVDSRASQPYADARSSQPYVDSCSSQPYVDSRSSQPYVDSRGSQPAIASYPVYSQSPQPQPPQQSQSPAPYADPRALALAGPVRGSQPAFELFDPSRDAAVRRIVWALVLVFGTILALVVAQLL